MFFVTRKVQYFVLSDCSIEIFKCRAKQHAMIFPKRKVTDTAEIMG